jgi:very-short-patch-repair endonuclease
MDRKPLPAPDALRLLGGVASRSAVITISSRRRLRTALGNGTIVRVPGRDVVCLPPDHTAQATAISIGGVVSHTSAARSYGWAVLELPELPFVTIGPRATSPGDAAETATVVVRRLHERDLDGLRTTPLRTVLDCARDLPFPEALTVADSALREEAVAYDELLAAVASVPRRDRARVRRVISHADGRAANSFESELRAHCIEVGLDVIAQWEIRAAGLTLHPDLANPLLGIVVEAESWAHHGAKREDFVNDVVRYNALAAAGWIVIRFTWEQVRFNPRYVRATLRAAMTAASAAA